MMRYELFTCVVERAYCTAMLTLVTASVFLFLCLSL